MTALRFSLTALLLAGASALATSAFAQAPAAPAAPGAPAAAPAAPAAPAGKPANEDPKIKTFATLPTADTTENICQATDGSVFVTQIDVHKLLKISADGKTVTEFASIPTAANMLGVGCGANEVATVIFNKTFRGAPAVPATATTPAVPAGATNFADNDVHVLVYDLTGKQTADIPLPKGDGINGFDYSGTPGVYYGGNSGKPEIVRIDTKAKTATTWYDAAMYGPPPPGTGIAVNGVRYSNGWVYFKADKPGSNPAVPGLYRVQVGADGKPMGTAQTITEGLAIDDFDVAPDGSVYVPSGTSLYHVTLDGKQTKVADPVQPAASATVSTDGKTVYLPTKNGTDKQRVIAYTIQ